MLDHVYVARQPIVTTDNSIYGYELLFRSLQPDGSVQATFTDGMLATANVVVNALNHMGIKALVGNSLASININKALLLDDMLLGFPKDRFIVELLETIEVDDAVINRVKQLKALGYIIALDDADCSLAYIENFRPIFPFIDILKLDISLITLSDFEKNMEVFKSIDCKLLAEKVETLEEYERYKGLGCELFQGYFFAKPDLFKKQILDPNFSKIFKLINLLNEDTDIATISSAFEHNPEITLQLLRFMNSGSLNLNSKIRSIAHAISLLGKPTLKQWLLLIAFAQSKSGGGSLTSPLIVLVQSRAKLMSELMRHFSNEKARMHEAALVGILSLIDVITGTSIEAVLAELEVDEIIENALLKKEGDLGVLLEIAISMERLDIDKINLLLGNIDMMHDMLQEALMKSYTP